MSFTTAFQRSAYQNNAFQKGTPGNAFQNTAFQSTSGHIAFQTTTPATVTPVTTGGGAGVVIRHEPHRYSYEKYRKYRELLLAEREARKRALELKNKKDRKALVAAVEAAKQAARALSDEEDAAERTHELTLAIQQSVHARTVAETITRSYEVRRLAAEILARIEDEEESLLLLH